MRPYTPASIESPKTLVAACGNGVAGVLIFAVLPMLLGGFADQYGLNDVQTGVLGSTYFGLYALVALSSVLWIQRVNWRLLSTVGIAVMVTGLGLCRLFPHYQGALMGLAAVGMGAALTYPVSFTLIACRREKDRDYAIKLIPEQLVPGILLVVTATFFADQLSAHNFLLLLIGLLLAPLALSRVIPDNPAAAARATTAAANGKRWVILGLIALNLYFMGFAGLWAFLERIGSESAIDQALVGQLLALGLLTSAIGPFIAAAVGDRFGRSLPLCIAMSGSLLSLLFGLGTITALKFGAIMAILPLVYYFGIAYFFGIIADADSSGRFTALTPFALAVGAAMGPYLFGVIKSVYGVEGAYAFVAISIVAGTLLIGEVNRRLFSHGSCKASESVAT